MATDPSTLNERGKVKSLTLLWQEALHDRGAWCRTSTDADWKTVSRRLESEGLSFLTITLAQYGKDFEKALDRGCVGSDLFLGFKRRGGLPIFLSGFLRLVFEPGSGVLHSHPSIDAIQAVRQLTLMYGKLQIPCSETRNRKAVDGYVQCEMEVRDSDRRRGPDITSGLRRTVNMLFGDVLDKIEGDLQQERYDVFLPKHGPGATADRLVGNQKFLSRDWSQRLDRVFRAEVFLLPSTRHYAELNKPGRYTFHEPGGERPVKVTLVPKTLKTPRIIAMEPTCMQYAQQALLSGFLHYWYKDDLLPQFVDFKDQEPNRVLAREGSRTGLLSTLDLSEASDRVSNQLVIDLFAWWPAVAEAIQAVRSRSADVPYGHGVIRLAKYASMGSAMTFLMESIVFTSIVFYSIEKAHGHRLSRSRIKRYIGSVRVFGDDIIVPTDTVQTVISDLEAFGFKVNTDKSFWTGKFRESCGGDYYDGHDVGLTRVRKKFPVVRSDVEEVESMVSLRNQLFASGYWKTCQWIDEAIGKVLPHYPIVESTSSVLGRHSFLPYKGERMCPTMHRPLVKGFVTVAKPPVNKLDGLEALLKFFLLRGVEPLEAGHLERSGRPRTVGIKARWATPF